MIQQHIEIVGLNRVLSGLGNIDRGLETLKPLWEEFGDEFYRQEELHFDRQDFAPLSPAYAEWKRETFGDKPILRATDALFQSLTQEGAQGNIHRVTDRDAEFGTSDFKAMLHRTGTSRMPARDPLAEPDVDRYTTIAGEYMNDLLRRAGFN